MLPGEEESVVDNTPVAVDLAKGVFGDGLPARGFRPCPEPKRSTRGRRYDCSPALRQRPRVALLAGGVRKRMVRRYDKKLSKAVSPLWPRP